MKKKVICLLTVLMLVLTCAFVYATDSDTDMITESVTDVNHELSDVELNEPEVDGDSENGTKTTIENETDETSEINTEETETFSLNSTPTISGLGNYNNLYARKYLNNSVNTALK